MSVVPLRRRLSIGCSDAAAACGVDPSCSAVELWLYLTGRVEREQTEAMRWGALLRPVILAELSERGYIVTPEDGWELIDPSRPWLVGHPAGIVELPVGTAVLVVKTSSHWQHATADDVPLAAAAQAQLYMALAGLPLALVAILVGGQRLELRELTFDPRAVELLLAGVDSFAGYLTTDTAPPPDGSQSARDALAALYPDAQPAKRVRLVGDDWQTYRELKARREQRDAIERQVTELENRLKAAMADAEVALSPFDTEVVHWRNVTTHRIDTKAIREQRPHWAELFTVATTTRRFTVQ